MAILFTLLTLGFSWALIAVYHAASALVARRCGVDVHTVNVGIGPTLVTWTRPTTTWTLKLIPVGGATLFEDVDSDVPGELAQSEAAALRSIDGASLAGRLLILLTGPLLMLLVGTSLLGAAVALGSPQLEADPPSGSEAPVLIRKQDVSTTAGQARLAAATGGRYCLRLATFRTMDGWGGYVAFWVTTGRTGAASWMDWLTLFGIAALVHGGMNLVPLPPLAGYHVLHALIAACLGRTRLPDRLTAFLAVAGILFHLVIYARVVWLDAWWIVAKVAT